MLRQIISIVLIFVMAFIQLGFTLNTHYCGNEQISKTLLYSENLRDGCDFLHKSTSTTCETSCCQNTQTNHHNCCDDEYFTADTSYSITYNFNAFDLDFICSDIFEVKKATFFVYNPCVAKIFLHIVANNSPPLYKLFCSLLFYA
ncbi:MAG: hypothetical protein Q4B43_02135 [Bacteroidota bacterium]|nr:hypothetical protein [Bacteroidota bacterium]